MSGTRTVAYSPVRGVIVLDPDGLMHISTDVCQIEHTLTSKDLLGVKVGGRLEKGGVIVRRIFAGELSLYVPAQPPAAPGTTDLLQFSYEGLRAAARRIREAQERAVNEQAEAEDREPVEN